MLFEQPGYWLVTDMNRKLTNLRHGLIQLPSIVHTDQYNACPK